MTISLRFRHVLATTMFGLAAFAWLPKPYAVTATFACALAVLAHASDDRSVWVRAARSTFTPYVLGSLVALVVAAYAWWREDFYHRRYEWLAAYEHLIVGAHFVLRGWADSLVAQLAVIVGSYAVHAAVPRFRAVGAALRLQRGVTAVFLAVTAMTGVTFFAQHGAERVFAASEARLREEMRQLRWLESRRERAIAAADAITADLQDRDEDQQPSRPSAPTRREIRELAIRLDQIRQEDFFATSREADEDARSFAQRVLRAVERDTRVPPRPQVASDEPAVESYRKWAALRDGVGSRRKRVEELAERESESGRALRSAFTALIAKAVPEVGEVAEAYIEELLDWVAERTPIEKATTVVRDVVDRFLAPVRLGHSRYTHVVHVFGAPECPRTREALEFFSRDERAKVVFHDVRVDTSARDYVEGHSQWLEHEQLPLLVVDLRFIRPNQQGILAAVTRDPYGGLKTTSRGEKKDEETRSGRGKCEPL